MAIVALRLGRKPYEVDLKSASKTGSSTSFAAICTTRSRTVGIPSGRFLPSDFVMYCRRTISAACVPSRRDVTLFPLVRLTLGRLENPAGTG